MDSERTLSLLRNILEGVKYIHSRGIMHRDLKVRTNSLLKHRFSVDQCEVSYLLQCTDTYVMYGLCLIHYEMSPAHHQSQRICNIYSPSG